MDTLERQSGARSELQDAILDAAGRLFQRYGYRKTTVEDVANEARLSRGTIYQHFSGKEELALSWLARFHRCKAELMEEIARGSGSPDKRLESILVARVLFAFDRVQGYAESLDEMMASLRPRILEQREKHREQEAAILAELVRDGFKPADPHQTARLMLLAMNSLMPYNLGPRDLGERADVEKKARGLARLLIRGIEGGNQNR